MNRRKPMEEKKYTTDQKMISPSPTQQAALALTVVLLMLLTPGPVIEAITAWLAMPVMPPTESEFPTDKVVHFAMFAVCAFLSFRAWAVRLGTLVMLTALLIFAALTESLQMVIPGRSGDLMDFLADATGVLMAFWWYQHSAGRLRTGSNE
jgi:hypothetical protein